MKIFLIRHAETVHNVGQVWAGKTDSPLTNHGILQIQRLAHHFSAAQIRFTHVFSSDLQRAVATAEGIQRGLDVSHTRVATVRTALLQERDFGSWEGVSFKRQPLLGTYRGGGNAAAAETATTRSAETEMSMRRRINMFLSQYFLPALGGSSPADDDEAIAIVAHGVILRVLWTCLVEALSPIDVQYRCSRTAIEPHWSNTGYMELSVRPCMGASKGLIAVLSINNTTHLRDLRRTGGGIGSSEHDARQRNIESFFKARE